METERITFGENWWEVRKKLTVGMQRASEELSSQYISEKGIPQEQFQSIPLKVRLQMNRVMVFGATTAWSYGPVTEAVFENEVPIEDYDVILRRLNELYGSIPLSRTGDS